MLVPVLGDVAHTAGEPLANGQMGDIGAVHHDFAALEGLQTGQAVDQLRLAVAVDTGDTDDFAPADLEGHIVDGVVLVVLGGHGHVLHIQHHVAQLHRGLFHDEVDVAAHHHGRQGFRRGILDVHGADVLALAEDRTAVGHLHNFRQLVGDEENALALGGQILHDGHELLDFLRRQHGGGLVENQDFIVPVQHLEDFGPLLHTHGDILNDGVGVHGQAVLLRQGHNLFPGLGLLEETALGGLRAEDDVVQNAEAFHQLEVLVHHADAQGVGVVGVMDGDGLAVLADFALLRLVETEENAHQGGFAGAVFAQQCVNLTLFQL